MIDDREMLPIPHRALLWCIRMWVLELERGIDAQRQIDDMLGTLGVSALSPALRDLMDALSQGSTRMIEVRCVSDGQVSPDERKLLNVLSLAQSLQFHPARTVLRRFVNPVGADIVIAKAEVIGTGLLQAGHSLSDLDEDGADNRPATPFDALRASHASLH